MKDWKSLVTELELLPHPEGGYYKETFRSPIVIPTPRPERSTIVRRSLSTSILFLLLKDNFSAFHKIQQDELWYFQGGDGVCIHELSPEGEYIKHQLHLDPAIGRPQILIPAHSWFASEVILGGEWSLSGCMVSPGFDFEDFEMAVREDLLKDYPKFEEVVRRMTR